MEGPYIKLFNGRIESFVSTLLTVLFLALEQLNMSIYDNPTALAFLFVYVRCTLIWMI